MHPTIEKERMENFFSDLEAYQIKRQSLMIIRNKIFGHFVTFNIKDYNIENLWIMMQNICT